MEFHLTVRDGLLVDTADVRPSDLVPAIDHDADDGPAYGAACDPADDVALLGDELAGADLSLQDRAFEEGRLGYDDYLRFRRDALSFAASAARSRPSSRRPRPAPDAARLARLARLLP